MRKLAALLAVAGVPLAAPADEGMWPFDHFPADRVRAAYGAKVTGAWLDHARLSSARIAQGCSASFVSARGLVMTNHHCVSRCVEQLSSAERDLVASGFHARTAAEEIRCPVLEVNQLLEISDVTDRMRKATAGLEGEGYLRALQAETARIERECQTSPTLLCSVVSLWHGEHFDLHRYRRHPDVRLAWVPEQAAASFGGDPDNFAFPRFALDAAFLRVYEDGKPLEARHWFRWSRSGAAEGELVFVTGHPGSTSRLFTLAQLEYERDVELPERIAALSELRGTYTEFQRRGPEQRRVAETTLHSVENGLKVAKGKREALVDKDFFGRKAREEEAFRRRLAADPRLAPDALQALAAIERAQAARRAMRHELRWVAGGTDVRRGTSFSTTYFEMARSLVRGAAELSRPNEQRLPEFGEARLPELTRRLFSPAPIDDELETLKLAHALTKMREQLGPDHAFTRKVLGQESPDELAARLVKGTRLRDVALRRRLWEGGQAAVLASDDPMVAFALRVDADARAARERYERQVESVVKKASETLARARFALEGASGYPDATFTLRLTYGTVKGWKDGERTVPPFTTVGGAFERHTGRPPFDLPRSWLEARNRLDPRRHLNLVADTDIIGGNSGSPMLNAAAEVVGLVFDGNTGSLGGDYAFDEAVNRTVAVDAGALLDALHRIYGADRLVREIEEARAPPAGR